MNQKRALGQFYTTNRDVILTGLTAPKNVPIIEPFCGRGDLVKNLPNSNLELYDIDPKYPNTIRQDVLKHPPIYKDKFILTNPPYLLRNKNKNKEIYDMYGEDDLYSCFIRSFINSAPLGGILIIPINFICQYGLKIRSDFFSTFAIVRINVFEYKVFPDTTTAVLSLKFKRHPRKIVSQHIKVFLYSKEGQEPTFRKISFTKTQNFSIGFELFKPIESAIKVGRMVQDKPLNGFPTNVRVCCLDTTNKRIEAYYSTEHYVGKESARTECQIVLSIKLTKEQELRLIKRVNELIESARERYLSLFLPTYREGSRKRLPFDLLYNVIKACL